LQLRRIALAVAPAQRLKNYNGSEGDQNRPDADPPPPPAAPAE
jgi:hypothetical protein